MLLSVSGDADTAKNAVAEAAAAREAALGAGPRLAALSLLEVAGGAARRPSRNFPSAHADGSLPVVRDALFEETRHWVENNDPRFAAAAESESVPPPDPVLPAAQAAKACPPPLSLGLGI